MHFVRASKTRERGSTFRAEAKSQQPAQWSTQKALPASRTPGTVLTVCVVGIAEGETAERTREALF